MQCRCTGAVLVHLCRSSISMLRDLTRRWSQIAGILSPFAVHLMPCLRGSKLPEMAHRLALKAVVTEVSQLVMEAGDSSQTLRRRMATKIHRLCTTIYLVYVQFCYIRKSAVTAASSNCFPCEAVDFLTTASMNKDAYENCPWESILSVERVSMSASRSTVPQLLCTSIFKPR